jgi:hypothetical protein
MGVKTKLQTFSTSASDRDEGSAWLLGSFASGQDVIYKVKVKITL